MQDLMRALESVENEARVVEKIIGKIEMESQPRSPSMRLEMLKNRDRLIELKRREDQLYSWMFPKKIA